MYYAIIFLKKNKDTVRSDTFVTRSIDIVMIENWKGVKMSINLKLLYVEDDVNTRNTTKRLLSIYFDDIII